MQGLEDEEGVRCMVCQEGYRFKPREILGIYVYCSQLRHGARADADQGGLFGFEHEFDDEETGVDLSVVSHFNFIHFSCHRNVSCCFLSLLG